MDPLGARVSPPIDGTPGMVPPPRTPTAASLEQSPMSPMSPEFPVADPEDLHLDMYFAKLVLSFPKVVEPMILDEIKFSFISKLCDVLPVLCTPDMKDLKSSSDLAPTPYNVRANRKLYSAIVDAVTPAADGSGSATILGKLRLGCPIGNGLKAWYILRLHLELGETGPAAYQAQMNELRFKKKSGLEQYLINFERLRALSGATDATAVLALITAINECGDADVKQHFEWARSAPGMSYDYTNIVKQLLSWCTRLRQEGQLDAPAAAPKLGQHARVQQEAADVIQPKLTSAFQKQCDFCGREGHEEEDCRTKQKAAAEAQAAAAANANGRRRQRGNRGAQQQQQQPQQKSRQLCNYIQQGVPCKFGDNCRFVHDTGASGTALSTAAPSTAAPSTAVPQVDSAMLSMIQQAVERRLAAPSNNEIIRMQTDRPKIRAPRRFVKRRAAADDEAVDEPDI